MYTLLEHVINEINAKQLAGLTLAGTLALGPLTAGHKPMQHKHHAPVQSKYSVGHVFNGKASTYGWGEPLHPLTADGTPFNGDQSLVAMELVPLETIVTVESLKTGKKADFTVKDFGPAKHTGRIIDLSRVAWQRLGLGAPGVTDVKVTIKQLGTGRP